MTAPSTIHAEQVSVQLGGKSILHDIDVSLRVGEMVGLIGPNGAGKTTLMRALLGLVEADGRIDIDDVSVQQLDNKQRARRFAYLPQGGEVHWPLTVHSLVALGRLPHKTPWQSMNAGDEAIIDDVLQQTGTSGFRDRVVTHLSGGERARVMLARALASKAPFLFADEPAAALDPRYQLEMMGLLKGHVTDQHGAIVVMHDLNLAQHFCDRLLVIHEGKLVADGPPSDVLSDNLLKTVFGVSAARWEVAGDSFIVPNSIVDA